MSRVIDFHAHFLPQGAIDAADTGKEWHGTVLTRNAKGKPWLKTGSYETGLGAVEYWEGPEQRIEAMDASGIDVTAISVAPPMFRYSLLDGSTGLAAARETNDTLRDWCTEWPDRFLGFANVPLQDIDLAIAELTRAVQDLGLIGASIGTHVGGTTSMNHASCRSSRPPRNWVRSSSSTRPDPASGHHFPGTTCGISSGTHSRRLSPSVR